MAGFQVNMAPLERSSMGIGSSLVDIGKAISYSRQDSQQQAQQGEAEDLMRRALGGDPEAFKELTVKSPQAAMQAAEYLQSQQAGQQQQVESAEAEKLKANQDTIRKLYRIQSLPEDQQATAMQDVINNPLDDFDETDLPHMNSKNLEVVANQYGFDQNEIKAMFGGDKKLEQGKGGMEGYSFDTATGEYAINPKLKARLEEVKSLPELDAKTRQSINKDFTQLTSDTKLIRNTAADLDKLSKIKSGPASIAMVFKFMKALDPTSVVREGEFATAENSAGIPEALRNTYNKLMEGGRLGTKQIEQFVFTAKSLANSAIESSNTEVGDFIGTFEDTLTDGFKKALINRIPKPFDIKANKAEDVNTDSLSDDDLLNQYGGQ
jgi:hypothetical protein